MKKVLLKLFVVLSSALLLVFLIFYTDSFDELNEIIKYSKKYWLAAGFGCMVVYWVIDAFVLNGITRTMMERQPLKNTIRVTMIGQFFNSITPLAGAGQPVQAYVMVKDGIKPGHAISIFIIKTVLHQVVIVLYTIAAFIIRGGEFAARLPNFYYFFVVGLAINIVFMLVNLIFLYNRKMAEKILMLVFKVLRRIKFIKNLDSTEKKLNAELESFSEGAIALKKNISSIFLLIFEQAIQYTFMFAIPFFIQLAIEPQRVALIDVLAAQSMIMLISMLVPTPGSNGGVEGLSSLS